MFSTSFSDLLLVAGFPVPVKIRFVFTFRDHEMLQMVLHEPKRRKATSLIKVCKNTESGVIFILGTL